jgi:hypothetical protein
MQKQQNWKGFGANYMTFQEKQNCEDLWLSEAGKDE